MIYVTGDTHGSFERVERFCKRFETCREDILIILGDAGINFSGPKYDRLKKKLLVDKSTEIWLDKIEERLSYKKWYCGHYHTEKKINKLEIMFENFDEFGLV